MKNLLCVLLAAWATVASAAVPNVLTYRGVIAKGDGTPESGVVPITFSIYDSAHPGVALWSRTFTVVADKEGAFYVELNDRMGANALKTTLSLTEALASVVEGEPELGLAINGEAECRPRQRLGVYLRATRAASAYAADAAYTPGMASVAGGAYADAVSAGAVTVPAGGAVTVPEKCSFASMRERPVGGSAQTTVVVGGVSMARAPLPLGEGCYRAGDDGILAPCDLMLVYDSDQGAFNAIVPRGGQVVTGSGTAAANFQTVGVNAFGAVK